MSIPRVGGIPQTMLEQLREAGVRIAELEAERDRLRKRIGHEFIERGEQHFVDLERENALLKKALEEAQSDTTRLDWMNSHPHGVVYAQGYRGAASCWSYRDGDRLGTDAVDLRAAIDAAALARIQEAKR